MQKRGYFFYYLNYLLRRFFMEEKLSFLIDKGWNLQDQKLIKTFYFNNFKEVVLFFNAVSFLSEKNNHHPNFAIGYKHCNLELYTHSENKVTDKDIDLAYQIEKLINN